MNEKINLNKLPSIKGKYKIAEPLKKYTWLNVGGPADVMFLPADIEDLQFFLQNLDMQIPVFILGGGSNLLVRDKGIRGVVIKLQAQSFAKWNIEDNTFYCGCGMLNNQLKDIVISNNLGGLEFLCSIPGTIGGALRSNAGCFGNEISDVLQNALVINRQGKIFKVMHDDFHFAYRHSEFPADWIVLQVGLKYSSKTSKEIADKIQEHSEYRKTHQPQGIRTAGSTFKNPQGQRAWELIKNSGAAELTVGGVKMSPQHCNFLFNDGTATAADIEQLCDKITDVVKKTYNTDLELEICKVGQE